MKSNRYELIVYKDEVHEIYGKIGRKIKRFIGNDKNLLSERFEKWFIKQPFDRDDITVYVGEIQHNGY